MANFMSSLRKWSRTLHRDLSYFFTGTLLVYAISGFVLNLQVKDTFNPNKDFKQKYFTVENLPSEIGETEAAELCEKLGIPGVVRSVYEHYKVENEDNYEVEIAVKNGKIPGWLYVDTDNGNIMYKYQKLHPVLSAFNSLHFARPKWWDLFSYTFLVALVIIILTGLVMVKGRNGLAGRGGIELAIGILIPVLFMILV